MLTFEELYKKVVASSLTKQMDPDLIKLEYDPYHLECVLTPEFAPQIWNVCDQRDPVSDKSFIKCLFKHLTKDEKNKYTLHIDNEHCKNCLDEKKIHRVLASKDSMSVLEAIHKREQPVYALVAPAFLSQFEILSDGQLRSAFKKLGFAGMVEISLFADILTLKESLEFNKEINNEEDFQLTSCCCPVWISLIRKTYPELLSHVPKAVSPMVATGRVIKKLIPHAFTVFIGPCIAKKIEAKEEDIRDAIDVVLTFQEVRDIFEAGKVNAEDLPSDLREHSSHAGRIYAITGGVSQAVSLSVKRINPEKPIQVKAVQANGIGECKELLRNLEHGLVKANFLEGMACVGGCVGGPKAIIDKDAATKHVKKYADESLYKTPIDNPYVIELLHRLDMRTIDELLEDHEIFSRHF